MAITGRFILRTDARPNDYGEYQVNIQYCTGGKALKKATGIKVKPEHWLGGEKLIKTGKDGHPNADLLNKSLIDQKRQVDEILEEIAHRGEAVTVPLLRSILNGTYFAKTEEDNGKVDFVQFVLDYNYSLYQQGKTGYSVWVNVQCYMNKFSHYVQKVKKIKMLYCTEVEAGIIKDYIRWRKDNNKHTTINKSLTPIIKAVKECCRRGWLDRDVADEIADLYLPTGCSIEEESGVKALNKEQLKQLKALAESSKYNRTRDFVDIFMFSVCACGLRISDIATLKWTEVDMETKMIKHYQVKNHRRKAVLLHIPFNDMGLEILNRWAGRYGRFVFGMLADDFDLADEQNLKYAIASQNRSINQSLKCLGQKMQLPFTLHMHIARHTFAVMALNAGMDIKTISTVMGHSSVLTTEKVYAAYLPSTIQETYAEKFNLQI